MQVWQACLLLASRKRLDAASDALETYYMSSEADVADVAVSPARIRPERIGQHVRAFTAQDPHGMGQGA